MINYLSNNVCVRGYEVWRKVGPTGRFIGLSHAVPEGTAICFTLCGVDICKDGWEESLSDEVTCQRCRTIMLRAEEQDGRNSG